MDPGRWQRVETIFHGALKRDGDERESYLSQTCDGDATIEADVRSLLSRVPAAESVPERVAHYRIVRRLGAGGMGVVYEAFDEKLLRPVALKVLRRDGADPIAAERLAREARVAARVVHPLICQVFELGESPVEPYIAMELVGGESLAERLAKAPMPPKDALRLGAAILDALAVLHDLGIVHRDLKPSNVFVTATGIKLLDFGLARPLAGTDDGTGAPLTAAGMFVGTPRYASPEQLTGAAIDARSDLFSAAVVVFEMLTGRTPFTGATLAALAQAVMHETPPVLTGSPAIVAADRALHRALAKSPDDRCPTAAGFAAELRAALAMAGAEQTVETRSILRLAVLPFRQLRPDADTAYLGPSLADALAGSLGGLESLVVRSTLQSARYSQPPLDLAHIAADLAVDVLLTGTLLSSRDRIRVSAELVAVPSGDSRWSHTTDASPDGVLDLHDDLAARVRAALPLSARDRRAARSHAANEKAFTLFLRGTQLRAEAAAWRQSLAFFEQSLACDPGYAAAWAERGRLERILGKFEDPTLLARAEESLRRALAIDPDDGSAVLYLAQLEIDLGRVPDALARLLDRAGQRRAEPQVFAGLVHACRYAGLLDASVASHRAAVRLDPTVSTSILHTHYHRGSLEEAFDELHRSSDPIAGRILGAMGRRDEAIAAAIREEARFSAIPLLKAFSTGLRAALQGRSDEAIASMQPFAHRRSGDGEMLFYVAEVYALAQDAAGAFTRLHEAVAGGFLCPEAFERNTFFGSLRTHPDWPPLMDKVRTEQARLSQVFESHRGPTLLGL